MNDVNERKGNDMNKAHADWLSADDNWSDARRYWAARIGAAATREGVPFGARARWIEERVEFATELFIDGKPLADLQHALRRPIAWLRQSGWRLPSSGRRKKEWRPYRQSSSIAGDDPARIVAAAEGVDGGVVAIVGEVGEIQPGGEVRVTGGSNMPRNDGRMALVVEIPLRPVWRMVRVYAHQTRYDSGTVRDEAPATIATAEPRPPMVGADWREGIVGPRRPCHAARAKWRREGLRFGGE